MKIVDTVIINIFIKYMYINIFFSNNVAFNDEIINDIYFYFFQVRKSAT